MVMLLYSEPVRSISNPILGTVASQSTAFVLIASLSMNGVEGTLSLNNLEYNYAITKNDNKIKLDFSLLQ